MCVCVCVCVMFVCACARVCCVMCDSVHECYTDVVTDRSLAVPANQCSNEGVLDKVVSEAFSEERNSLE